MDYQPKQRDKVAVAICNLILLTVASKKYRNYLTGIIRYGMIAPIRDTYEQREDLKLWMDKHLNSSEESE